MEGAQPEAQQSGDDRDQALFWYLHLLIENKVDEGVLPAELARRTGITKAQISQIQAGRPGGGILSLIRFSPLTGMTPGELLDTALRWWEHDGRAYKARRLRELAEISVRGKPRRAGRSADPARSGLNRAARVDFEAQVARELGKGRDPSGSRNTRK